VKMLKVISRASYPRGSDVQFRVLSAERPDSNCTNSSLVLANLLIYDELFC
jgi:hypothetical protein